MGQEQTYRYRVDATDLLVWVDEWWLAFARENGAPELTAELVLGRRLWDFISGEVTRRLFSEIHAQLRLSGKSAVLPFRCDSPSLQRHMRMTITVEDAGQLLYESVLLRVEPQNHLEALDPGSARSKSFLTMCSCCKRALLEPMGWLSVADVSVRLRLFDKQDVPELRYTVCPECANTMKNASVNGDAA